MHRCVADRRNLFALTVMWVAMTALLAPVGDFPLNDDWVYARAVRSILDTGRFQLLDWSVASAFPQAYWGALFCRLFGFSFTTLRFSTLVLGLGGVLVTYSLLRQSRAAPGIALLGAMTLAANPLYFAMSNTFMTDVPFYFLAVASLLSMTRGFQRDEPAWLMFGIVLSCLAILTRQLGIVLPLGFAVAYVWTRRATFRTTAIALCPLLTGLLLHFLLQQWLEVQGRVPGVSTLEILQDALPRIGSRFAMNGFTVLVYTGLFVLPVSLIYYGASFAGAPTRRGHGRWTRIWGPALLFAAILALVISTRGWMPFSRNVLTYFGIGPLTLRDTYILYSNNLPSTPVTRLAWMAITVLAALGTALLVDRCRCGIVAMVRSVRAEGRRAVGAAPVLLIVTVSGFVALIATLSHTFLDRYVLLCIPFALILVSAPTVAEAAAPGGRSLRAAAWLLVTMSAAFSLVAMHDYLAWNRARWTALLDLTERRGVSATVIDGGYEFNGWHLYEPGYRRESGKSWWWVNGDDYLVASGPVAGYREIASYPFERWLQRVHSRIVVLQRAGNEPPRPR